MLAAAGCARLARCGGHDEDAARARQGLRLERDGLVSEMISRFGDLVERYVGELAACVPAASEPEAARRVDSALLSRVASLVNEFGLLIAYVLIMSRRLVLPERKRRRKKKAQDEAAREEEEGEGELRAAVLQCFRHACDAIASSLDVLSLNLESLALALAEERTAVSAGALEDAYGEGDFQSLLADAPRAFRDSVLSVHAAVSEAQAAQVGDFQRRILTLAETFRSLGFGAPDGAA